MVPSGAPGRGGADLHCWVEHYVVLEQGQIQLNRMAKTDYLVLKDRAREEVARLCAAGGWDRG